jgi:hypothetical protein
MIPRLCLLLGMLSGIAANAMPIQFQSTSLRSALLELYTSEGCSSCPPAEAWLSRLKEAPGLWTDFVPVAFHVDYWDYLGWRDNWASRPFSDRQRDYSRLWASDSIYTPGFVLNGKEWWSWSGRSSLPTARGIKAGVLKVTSEDATHWRISFVPESPGTTSYDAHAALLISGVSSEVKAGENAGRRLNHDFAALTLIDQPLVRANDAFQATVIVDAAQKPPDGRLAIAVWVSPAGQLEPVQAAGSWLPEPDKN